MRRQTVNEQGYRIGEAHPNCKIPDALVRRLRDLHEDEDNPQSYAALAARFGIARATVEKICQYTRRGQAPHIGHCERPSRRQRRQHAPAETQRVR